MDIFCKSRTEIKHPSPSVHTNQPYNMIYSNQMSSMDIQKMRKRVSGMVENIS